MQFIYLFWLLSEIIISRAFRARSADRQGEDKHSLAIIWIVIIAATTAAVYISLNVAAPISGTKSAVYMGLGLLILGILLRFFIIASLGKFFTTNVTIRQEHVLKTDGCYKYIRHPAYAASLLSFAGFGISLNNQIALLVVLIAVRLAFYNRIRIEERLLVKHFGQQYIDYGKHTWRLIPFIF
ncbi:methyltransferase family protein [Niabella soli]|nr:isoprenylcysteine carboxylmethyltransferase family protein [Niabella soli]